MAIDWTLLKLCNSLAGRSMLLDTLIRILVNDYAVTTALALLLLALWFSGWTPASREQNQYAVLFAITAMFLSNLFVKLLNLLFYRPRPFAGHDVTLLFYRPSDSSFPSNSATVGFSLATAVWFFNRKAGLVMYILASLLGLARVCSGVHYPSDILGGLLIGVCVAYLIIRKINFLQRFWALIIRYMRHLLLA